MVSVTLRTWGQDTLVDAAQLLVSELVANSVLHAHTHIRVVIRHLSNHTGDHPSDRVRVEVHDGDKRPPTRKRYSALATTGRGLFLVERLSQDWGVASRPDGKSVWFELDEASAASPPDALALGFEAEDVDLLGVREQAWQSPAAPPPPSGGPGHQMRGRLRDLVGTSA